MTTVEQLEDHREALVGHCYRMLGWAVLWMDPEVAQGKGPARSLEA